jgi:hypothetical protein
VVERLIEKGVQRSLKIQPQRLGSAVNSLWLTRASSEISALRCLIPSHHC